MARGVAASYVAWYLCAMGDVYGRTVSDQGYGAAVEAVRPPTRAPAPQRGVVPAEAEVLLDEFTAHGTPPRSATSWRLGQRGRHVTMVALPPGIPWDVIEATLRAAAP